MPLFSTINVQFQIIILVQFFKKKKKPKHHNHFFLIPLNDFFQIFLSHHLISPAELTLKLTLTFSRSRMISKWPSMPSLRRYGHVVLVMLLVPFSTSYFVSFALLFCTKENGKTWCVVELQSCSVGEGRKYRVVRYWKEDISTKVCESFPTLLLLDLSYSPKPVLFFSHCRPRPSLYCAFLH